MNGNGSVRRTNSGATSSGHVVNSGDYTVTFGSDVSACAYYATIGNPSSNTSGGGDSGEINAFGGADDPGPGTNDVQVLTFDSTGSPDDRGFSLQVFCQGA